MSSGGATGTADGTANGAAVAYCGCTCGRRRSGRVARRRNWLRLRYCSRLRRRARRRRAPAYLAPASGSHRHLRARREPGLRLLPAPCALASAFSCGAGFTACASAAGLRDKAPLRERLSSLSTGTTAVVAGVETSTGFAAACGGSAARSSEAAWVSAGADAVVRCAAGRAFWHCCLQGPRPPPSARAVSPATTNIRRGGRREIR